MSRFAWILPVLLLLPIAGAANDWPQFRYNETHQGLVPSSLNSEFTVFTGKWWSNLSVPRPPGSPSLRENIVYFGDGNGRIWAFDQESGGVIWSNTTSASGIAGAPAVGPATVWVVNKAGSLYGFNRKTGQLLPNYPLSIGGSENSILYHETEDTLYAASDTGVQAWSDLERGRPYQKWSFAAAGTVHGLDCGGGQVRTTPVIFAGQVMFGSTNKCFFSVNKTSFGSQATPNWVFKAIDSIRASPVVDTAGSKVIFADQSGNVYSIPVVSSKAVTSTPIYTEPTVSGLSSEIWATPAIVDSKIVIASRNGFVRALPLTGGSASWSRQLSANPVTSSPAVANGHILIGSLDRNMYMLKVSDGSVEGQWLATEPIESAPAISGTQGFWGALDGSLYSYGGTKPQRADLALQGLAVAPGVVGQPLSISATIKNIGALKSEATVAKLYAGSAFVSDTNVPELDAGGSMAYSGTYMPSTAGQATFRVFVDATRVVREADESNNDVTVTTTISDPPPVPTEGTGASTTGEPGIPGFEALLALFAVGLWALVRRRPE